jgi:hypothetical protein
MSPSRYVRKSSPTGHNFFADVADVMFYDVFEPIWATYYAPKLTARETNQFRQACHKPASKFLEQIIKPMAYQPDLGTYLCIAEHMDVKGRAHFGVQTHAGPLTQ